MFEKGKLYRHKNAKDVDFLVTSPPWKSGQYIWLTVRYWNHFYSTFQGELESVKVHKKDLSNWEEVS